jgi:hypothetical protein
MVEPSMYKTLGSSPNNINIIIIILMIVNNDKPNVGQAVVIPSQKFPYLRYNVPGRWVGGVVGGERVNEGDLR